MIHAGARVTVASRGPSASILATELGGRSVDVSTIASLDDVDLIISCTSAPGIVLGATLVEEMQRHRGGDLLLVIDLAVPRDVDVAVGNLPGVELLDVDSLGRGADAGIGSAALADARRMLSDEAKRTALVLAARDATAPTIAALTTQRK